MQKTMPVPLVQ